MTQKIGYAFFSFFVLIYKTYPVSFFLLYVMVSIQAFSDSKSLVSALQKYSSTSHHRPSLHYFTQLKWLTLLVIPSLRSFIQHPFDSYWHYYHDNYNCDSLKNIYTYIRRVALIEASKMINEILYMCTNIRGADTKVLPRLDIWTDLTYLHLPHFTPIPTLHVFQMCFHTSSAVVLFILHICSHFNYLVCVRELVTARADVWAGACARVYVFV